jgi:hypothetical protein
MRTRRSTAKAVKAADDASDKATVDASGEPDADSPMVVSTVSTPEYEQEPGWEPREIRTADAILEVIECSMNRLMSVPLDEAMRASKVAQLANVGLKAVELAGLEKAVAELEAEDEVILRPL